MGETMQYAVYQPPQRKPEQSLPLVVFLHGGGDGPACFDEASIGQHLDAEIARGAMPPVVVAVPQGDLGFWENWVDGSRRYRDWVLREMLPHVRKKYSTAACPEGCHVMGISMGGYGAMRYAFLEPRHFSSVTAISAPIFDTDQMLSFRSSFWWGVIVPIERIWGQGVRSEVEQDDLYLRWRRQSDLRGLDLMLAWGDSDKDEIISTNRRFHAHLERQKIVHESQVFPGGHDWDAWRPVISRAISLQVATGGAPREQ